MDLGNSLAQGLNHGIHHGGVEGMRGMQVAEDDFFRFELLDVYKRQVGRGRRQGHEKFRDGFPVLVLPADHPRSARRDFVARRLDHPVAASDVQELRALAAKQGCSFFAVLLSSLVVLLARVSQQRRFVIALPTAEQPDIGQPGLVGHCVNLLPFMVEFREGEALGAFVQRVQADLLGAQDHALFTMVSLLEDLHPVAPALGISPCLLYTSRCV